MSETLFTSLAVLTAWKDDYNNTKPHRALGTSHRPNTPIAAFPGRNGTGRCAMPRAPRPTPLLHRARWAQIPPGLYPLLDEARGPDQCKSSIISEIQQPAAYGPAELKARILSLIQLKSIGSERTICCALLKVSFFQPAIA